MAARPDAGLLRVRVQPRASHAGIAGWRPDGALGVRVTAAPVDGAANAAVGTAPTATAPRPMARASKAVRMINLPVVESHRPE